MSGLFGLAHSIFIFYFYFFCLDEFELGFLTSASIQTTRGCRKLSTSARLGSWLELHGPGGSNWPEDPTEKT